LAFLGFLVFFSFHIEKLGPIRTVKVGINISPWLTWSQIKGAGEFGKKLKIDVLSWSAAGLLVGTGALVMRSRIR
jgi:hypothetical protein